MNIPMPESITIGKDGWNEHLCKHVPALDKLYKAKKFDEFENYKILASLDYNSYIKEISKTMAFDMASQIAGVQPMSQSVGRIMRYKKISRKSLT